MAENEDLVAELLAEHALGRLPPLLAAIVAAHVEMSPTAARGFAGLESLADRALEAATPTAVTDRDRRLAGILAIPRPAAPAHSEPREPDDLPGSLRRLVAGTADLWQTAWPGVRRRPIARLGDFTAELIRVEGHHPIPDHDHGGLEAMLVLEGGFTDGTVAHGRGDLAVADAETVHRPIADAEGCLCFVVLEGEGIRPIPATEAGG